VKRTKGNLSAKKRFGTEAAVEKLTGFSRRTLQKDRQHGRPPRFPWYKVGGRVLYDLLEVERIIRSTRRGEPAEVR
jgi:hypothetical protein